MKIEFEFGGVRFYVDSDDGLPIGISVEFGGSQPNHFGAPKATRDPLKLGGFVGDTRQGGGCNVDVIEMVPHCNGTHTETVGHIVDQTVGIGTHHLGLFSTATLVQVNPESAVEARKLGESYRPALMDSDQVISADHLKLALEALDLPMTDSLVVSTGSDVAKKAAEYSEENQPPFFTVEAMELIVNRGFKHLLVDFPSVDRMYDDGLLTNHHLFWNVPEGTHDLKDDSLKDKTITEMVFVSDEVKSGMYLLNLQLPSFNTDAAPSRPILFQPKKVDG
ncbi:cyclase family protein [bacterium]|nr:cyclase family protein [bacterium]